MCARSLAVAGAVMPFTPAKRSPYQPATLARPVFQPGRCGSLIDRAAAWMASSRELMPGSTWSVCDPRPWLATLRGVCERCAAVLGERR